VEAFSQPSTPPFIFQSLYKVYRTSIEGFETVIELKNRRAFKMADNPLSPFINSEKYYHDNQKTLPSVYKAS